MSAPEQKYCPRCQQPFVCRADNIRECQCYTVALTEEERVLIEGQYEDCLCRDCLEELKEKKI